MSTDEARKHASNARNLARGGDYGRALEELSNAFEQLARATEELRDEIKRVENEAD
jgi:uncharacterized protein Yka (UPF0111/DUF47 family)